MVSHQHGAKALPNGRVVMFDNGVHRFNDVDYSRAVEVDRENNEIVWSYADNPPKLPRPQTVKASLDTQASGVRRPSGM